MKSFFFFPLILFYVNLFCVSSKTNLVTVTASSYAGLSLAGKVKMYFIVNEVYIGIFSSHADTALKLQYMLKLV